MTSGISAKGIPNESTTWLITSTREGSSGSPMAITTNAGIIVTARRTNSGIRRLMNPCITTWPDNVPTVELDSPEAVSASAKSTLEAPPRMGSSVRCAPSSDSMFFSPLPKKTVAATTSIATLISPAIVIASTTSNLV